MRIIRESVIHMQTRRTEYAVEGSGGMIYEKSQEDSSRPDQTFTLKR